MKNVGGRMDGISLHYYTVTGWNGSKGSATDFNKDDYYWTMGKCLEIEDVVRKHIQIMDKYDPQKKIGLMVDEWEPGGTKSRARSTATCTSRTPCAMLSWQPSL